MKSGLGVIHEVKTTYWFDVFQNVSKIRKVHAPVFIIHGTHDEEIPQDHGRALYEACPVELAYDPWWVKEAGHNDIEINHRQLYFEHLAAFLQAVDSPSKNWRRAGSAANSTEDNDTEQGSEQGWQPLLGGNTYPYEPMR
uniref:Peptidase S9 prolyl oligopeptidase catalytic domain-containing protein n=1 Tax=Zooxanthella nutricula TaxID=1333877 RepID=A0A7S2PBQ2_9DINO